MTCIFLSAGGTGGHMFPALALANRLKENDCQVHFITDVRGAKYLPTDVSQTAVNMPDLGRRTPIRMPLVAYQIIKLMWVTFWYFIKFRPKVVIGFGGYVSGPILLLSKWFGVPYFIHEQNSHMGKVNRWFAGNAKKVMTNFRRTMPLVSNSLWTGLPVRKEILAVRDLPYPSLNGTLRLLIVGGSQGAGIFSKTVPQAIALLPEHFHKRLDVVQQCRAEDIEAVQKLYDRMGVKARLSSFFQHMDQELAASHLVVTRSGASTVTELATVGRPAIFVPFAAAMEDHQTLNAVQVVKEQAGWMIKEKSFVPEQLSSVLVSILERPGVLFQASVAMKSLGRCDATEVIASEINKVIG